MSPSDVAFIIIWISFMAIVGAISLWIYRRPFQSFRTLFVAPFGPVFRSSTVVLLGRRHQAFVDYFISHKIEEDDGSLGAEQWFKVRGGTRAMALLMALVACGMLLTIPISLLVRLLT